MNRIQQCFEIEAVETPATVHHTGYPSKFERRNRHERTQAVMAGRRAQIRQLEKAVDDLTTLTNELAVIPQTRPQLLKALNQADEEATRYQTERNVALAENTTLKAEVEQLRTEMAALHNLLEVAQDHSADRDSLEYELQEERNKVYALTHGQATTTTLTPAALDRITLATFRCIYQSLSPAERSDPAIMKNLLDDLNEPNWHQRSPKWGYRALHAGKVGPTPYEASEAAAIAAGKKRTAWGEGAIQPIKGGKDPKPAA